MTLYDKEPSFYKKFLKTYCMDDDGLPMQVREGKKCYNVVTLAQFGLMEYGYYLTNHKDSHRKNCLCTAQALLRLQDDRGGWPYQFDFFHETMEYTLPSGWYSAMGQGQAISLFARANTLEKSETYSTASHRALQLLETPVEEGGLLTKIGDHYVLEEYPTNPASYTLNGLIFAMIGLYDAANAFQDATAKQLFWDMMQTLQEILPLYDDDTYSCYDLSHLTNPPRSKNKDRKYHILHVRLLQALESIEHNDKISFYIDKWGKRWR